MSELDFSRRDVLGQGAMLAGAALAAGMLTGCEAGGKAMSLTSAPEGKPIKALGEGKQIRVGFVGVGGRGSGLLKDTLDAPGVTVKAICDLNPDRLKKAVDSVKAKQGHQPDAYTGDDHAYRKILERDDIDAVVLATPCYLHAPMYLDCAKAGKHFYGEKPAAISVAQANQLVAEVPKAGVVGYIGFQRRASKRYHECVKLIRDGELGDIIQTTAAWDNSGGPLIGWFSFRAKSGDWMLEQACHTWDVLNWVADKLPIAAYGAGRKDIYLDKDPKRDVTDYYITTLLYPGMPVRYSHSWGCPGNDMFSGVYERVYGSKASMDMESGQVFYYRDKDKPVRKVQPDEGGHHRLSIHQFYDLVRKGQQAPSNVFTGRDASLVGLLVRKAVDERRVVTMEEILKGP